MKILNFNEFINEGLWSKTLNRGRTGEVRLEDIDMTPDERECYKLLKEWCRGGQFNVENERKQQRFSFDQDFEQFQKNLYDGLSKLDCCKLLIDIPQYVRSKFLIANTLNNGWGGVIFTPSFQNKIRNEIYMFLMDETKNSIDYYSISTHYYDEDNVDIIRRKLKDLVLPNMDSPHGVYIAYRIPEKVMLQVMKENNLI